MLGREHELKALRVKSLSLLSTAGTPQTLESPLLIRGKAERRSLRREQHKPFSHENVSWYSYQQNDDPVINNLPPHWPRISRNIRPALRFCMFASYLISPQPLVRGEQG